MLDGSSFTEIEFKNFIQAGYGDQKLHPIQMTELRRAFYGGLSTACFNQSERELILSECKHFFESEVQEHLDKIKR